VCGFLLSMARARAKKAGTGGHPETE